MTLVQRRVTPVYISHNHSIWAFQVMSPMFKINLIYNGQHGDHCFEPVGPLFLTIAQKFQNGEGEHGCNRLGWHMSNSLSQLLHVTIQSYTMQ